MNKAEFNIIFGKMANPSRIRMYTVKNFNVVMSAKNTNDTYGWFRINAEKLEKELKRRGYKWIYQIETAPGQLPFIYLFFGKGIKKKDIEKAFEEVTEPLPDGRELFYEETPFNSIDMEQYDNRKIFPLEQMLINKSADVLEVIEA